MKDFKGNSHADLRLTKLTADGVLLTPPQGQVPSLSMIFLHGLGDSALGWVDIFKSEMSPLPPGARVRLLTAPTEPVSLNGGMPMNSWYDIRFIDDGDRSYDQQGVERNSVAVQEALEEEIKAMGGAEGRVFIGGFSQGCAMALHNGLSRDKLAGIVGLSGYLLPGTKIPPTNPSTLLVHGIEDPMVDIHTATKTYKREGFISRPNVSFNRIQFLDHSVNVEVLKMVRTFVSKVIK